MPPGRQKELTGRRILVTRALDQSGELGEVLRAQGAETVVCPLLRTEAWTGSQPEPDLAAFHWLVLTSPNAVRHLGARLAARQGRALLPPALRLAVVGPGTAAAAAATLGRAPDLCPAVATGAGLAAAFAAQPPAHGSRVLRVRGDRASSEVETALSGLGVVVETWTIYRTLKLLPSAAVAARLQRGEIDAVTFASGSAVAAFETGFPGHGRHDDLLAACLGPVTARCARAHRWRRILTAESPTVAALAATLADALGPAAG